VADRFSDRRKRSPDMSDNVEDPDPAPEDPTRFPKEPEIAPLDQAPTGSSTSDPEETPDSPPV
jgi:hypothetical protein